MYNPNTSLYCLRCKEEVIFYECAHCGSLICTKCNKVLIAVEDVIVLMDGSVPIHSFKNVLTKWLIRINPKRILEWGPGISTQIMVDTCPEAEIYSFEHNYHYYVENRERFIQNFNVHLYHVSKPAEYVLPQKFVDVTEKFDLIFVDGQQRKKCLMLSQKLVSERGVVILHDANRREYSESIKHFEVVDCGLGTKVLKK